MHGTSYGDIKRNTEKMGSENHELESFVEVWGQRLGGNRRMQREWKQTVRKELYRQKKKKH